MNGRRAAAILPMLLTAFLTASRSFGQEPPAQETRHQEAASAWQIEDSTTTADLRGIHAVGGGIAWASGTHGTVLRTEDGGYLWQRCAVPPGGEALDFRSIWAWDAQNAVVLSSGPGDQSRLYGTSNGCASWRLLYTNPDPKGFFDALVFTDRGHGVILGDPVDGKFVVLRTTDGGLHWRRATEPGLEANPKGEGAFAASNSSFVALPFSGKYSTDFPFGSGTEFFGTSAPGGPRVFYLAWRTDPETMQPESKEPGSKARRAKPRNTTGASHLKWLQADVPLARRGPTTGIFSLAFRDAERGVAVGGDYQDPGNPAGTAAFTGDNGRSWTAARTPPQGYRSSVAWDEKNNAWIAVGPNGSDVSYDDGDTWQPLPGGGNWNALSLPWAVGPKGRIGKLVSLGKPDHGGKP